MMQMSFAGLIPDYDCLTHTTSASADDIFSEDQTQTPNYSTAATYSNGTSVDHVTWSNDTLNVCTVNSTVCWQYMFRGSANSVVSQWNLVCDRKWIKPVITSVQMAGVLVGAVLAGHLGDMFGRKRTNFGFFLLHMFLNVIAGFSTSWEMFMVLRFCIGFCIGGLLVVLVPYMTEFLPTKWRPLVGAVPMWPLGVVVFAGTAWLLEDWAYLHLTCAALSAPVMLTYFIIPESPRWLAVHGRLKEANFVLEKMAAANGKVVPPYTVGVIEEISIEATKIEKGGKKYSYWDILNNFPIAKISIIFGFQWCAISIIFYGLSFGVSSFSGNLYLNIALMSIVEIPVHTMTFFLFNKIGRRWTTFAYFFVGTVAAFASVVVHYQGIC
ncbi:solute carrier family 22 member 21 [Elysia marginata]|uniref:Solute carrier family 22 member 21 n=1 Tax=Elysia marginata TaxID=1093978 RepID=A0AAV4IZ80_9GAST|nr:solute carrier family 22 member 21 [Elysia marginata]